MTSEKLNPASEWIRARQSIYPVSFTGELIPDKLIWELLENANAAPSHRNTEPWRFHVIPKFRLDSFADFYQAAYKQNVSPEKFNERKYKKIRKKTKQASHLIIVCMQRDQEESIPEWEELAATACAVQNIYLSLGPLGIAGYWSSPQVVIENIDQFVTLGEGEKSLGIFYLGMPQAVIPPQVEKGPVADKVTWLS